MKTHPGEERIHHTATIHPEAAIAPSARIGRNCRIGAGVRIGEDTVVESDCRLDAGTVVCGRLPQMQVFSASLPCARFSPVCCYRREAH